MCDITIAPQDTFDKLSALQLEVSHDEDCTGFFNSLDGFVSRASHKAKDHGLTATQAPAQHVDEATSSTWRSDYFGTRAMHNRGIGAALQTDVERRVARWNHNRRVGVWLDAEASCCDSATCSEDEEEECEELEFEVL